MHYLTIIIPIIFNNGIKGNIVLKSEPYLILKEPLNNLDSKYYYDINSFGYMQIDVDQEKNYYNNNNNSDLPNYKEYIEAIKKCYIDYYSNKFILKSNFFDLKNTKIKIRIRSIKKILLSLFGYIDMFNEFHFNFSFKNLQFFDYEEHEIVVDLKTPPFGLTWQKYFTDSNWLKNSKNLLT